MPAISWNVPAPEKPRPASLPEAVAKVFLRTFGIEILSHTTAIGTVSVPQDFAVTWEQLESIRNDDVVHCAIAEVSDRMVEEIEKAQKEGDTIGGTFEVIARGVPTGLGSHTAWDTRLDGQLAQAIMSINAVKAVEIGIGVQGAFRKGPTFTMKSRTTRLHERFLRLTNRAGGIEGGITNGEDVRVTGYLKPIPTLKKALRSVDMITKEPFLAQHERSDTCTVPAAGVIGETMVALVLARAFLENLAAIRLRKRLGTTTVIWSNFVPIEAQLKIYAASHSSLRG